MGLLLFADNCWLIGMSVAELQTMSREWYEFLKQAGLIIDWSEAVWCTTAQDILPGSIVVSGTTIIRRKREEGFKALGVWITLDGHFTKRNCGKGVSRVEAFFFGAATYAMQQ